MCSLQCVSTILSITLAAQPLKYNVHTQFHEHLSVQSSVSLITVSRQSLEMYKMSIRVIKILE